MTLIQTYQDKPYQIRQFDEGYRTDTVDVKYLRNSVIREDKAATVHGNFVDPLPYHHITTTTTCSGYSRRDEPSSIYSYGVPKRSGIIVHGAISDSAISEYLNVDIGYKRIDFFVPAGSYTEPDLKALVKLRQNQIEIGMALADARDTASGFVASAVNLQKALIAMKRGDFKTMYLNLKYNGLKGSLNQFKRRLSVRRNKWHGDLESRWLESQFATIPAINDIYTLSQAYENNFETWAPDIYIASKGKTRVSVNKKTVIKSNSNRHVETTTEEGFFIHATKIFGILNNYALKSLGKIGLDNPFVIAWDLVPFSFVADWFIPIGDFIKAWSARLGITFRSAYHSTLLDTRVTKHVKELVETTGPAWTRSQLDYTAYSINRAYKRTILLTMPIPNLYLKSNLLSLWKGATSLALLRQLLTPKHPSFLGFR